MAITASGLYGLTLEKMFTNTAGQSLEAETHKMMLVTDSYTPNFDTHDFVADPFANENTGTGYTTGGATIAATEISVSSPAAGQLRWDHDDVSWSSSTITAAMAGIDYFNVGSSATDQLIALLDFVTAVTTVSGLLTVQIATNGVFYLDFTP
jgi:hypothetical protein